MLQKVMEWKKKSERESWKSEIETENHLKWEYENVSR